MRIAFKEWAVIVEALGRGDQILILRKGGIAEGRGGFQVEHPHFWLFPTQFHQQREQVTPAGQRLFDELQPRLPAADRVRLEFTAAVYGWRRLESLNDALRLEGQHCWREEVIRERFEWGREAGIFVLVLRVARLTQPVELPMLSEYGGCRSWIELATDIPASSAVPVLSNDDFGARLQTLERSMGEKLHPRAPIA